MISCEFDGTRAEGRIILQPNHSWTWRANVCLVGTLMAVSGSVATLLAYRGLWLVLPFTFVEMSALLACLYYCVRRTHRQEVLTFSPDYLILERGVKGPQRRHRFQRYFTRFFVRHPAHPWYRKRVMVRSLCERQAEPVSAVRSHCERQAERSSALPGRGQELEVGSFLTGDERDDLVAALRDMIQRLDAAAVGSTARQ